MFLTSETKRDNKFRIPISIIQTIIIILLLPNFEIAQALSGSWTQTDWTNGSGQDDWSDATKYSAVTGEGVYNRTDLRMKINADVVIGQPNFAGGNANQGGRGANTLNFPYGVHTDSTRIFIADVINHRALIYNTIPTTNNASADVVIGQVNFTSGSINQGGTPGANTLNVPVDTRIINNKLFIADGNNNRVLIYNTIPTSNNASADVVIGQVNFTGGSVNQGGSVGANTLYYPFALYSDGIKLLIADRFNNRVLIYNTIPTSNNASANVIIGQANFTSNSANQGGSPKANTLYWVDGLSSDGTHLFVADNQNHRVLIYNTIPTTNNASADVVIGQQNFTSNNTNQGGSPAANTLGGPQNLYYDGAKLVIPDWYGNRMLIYSMIPNTNNASADIVIGQPNFTSGSVNQGGNIGANTLKYPDSASGDNNRLIIGEAENHRVLIYNLTPISTTLTSSVYDAGSEQEWGPINWTADTPTNTSITVEVSTDQGANWTAVANDQNYIGKSQTMQYRVTLSNTDGISTPTFSDITINYTTNEPPVIQIISPENKTYTSSTINLNYTATDAVSGVDSCLYEFNNSNTTIASCQNTTITIAEGIHILRVWANDVADNWGASLLIQFVVDLVPKITFISPTDSVNSQINRLWSFVNISITDYSNTTAFIDWNHSLVLWMRYNNESGENSTFFRDWSSYGNNGTCQETVCPADETGKFGRALEFNGLNNSITVQYSESPNITDKLTIETWVNATRGASLENIRAVADKFGTGNFTSQSSWAFYNTTAQNSSSKGFNGGVFDGRYVYFVPDRHNSSYLHGQVTRYDTTVNFTDSNSWDFYDTSAINSKSRGFEGGIFDGRYVYFIPIKNTSSNYHGQVTRYDTKGNFVDSNSWTFYDTELVNPSSKGFNGAVFDGKYIYLVPWLTGQATRYNTNGNFTDSNSWSFYNTTASNLSSEAFPGAVFDGRYVYFVPYNKKVVQYGVVMRYDTTANFTDSNSWSFYNTTALNSESKGFYGGVFDGRYLYFVPYYRDHVARYDTIRNFNESNSWSFYNTSVTYPKSAKGYSGGVFDGRYVYLGNVMRYDTTANFTDLNSWSFYNTTTLNSESKDFDGGVSDGKYLYFMSWGAGQAVRYDTTHSNASYSLLYGLGQNSWGSTPFGFGMRINTNNGIYSVFDNAIRPPGWHHIAGIYNGSSLSFYVDGTLAGTAIASGNISTSSAPLTIGSVMNSYFQGTIDEVRIHNRALSSEEINASYNAGSYHLYHNFTGLSDNESYTYTTYTQDTAGNINQTEERTVAIDMISPSVSLSLSKTAINTGESLVISCSATDNRQISSTSLTITKPSGTQVSASCGQKFTDTSSAGTYTVTYNALDMAGNSVSSIQTFTVISSGDSSSSIIVKTISFIPKEGYLPVVVVTLKSALLNPAVAVTATTSVPLPSPKEPVYQYISITKKNFNNSGIENATIDFKVNKSWILANTFTKIYLARYENGWNKLKTDLINSTANVNYYRTYTDAFSYFAIIGEKAEAIQAPASVVTPQPAENPPSGEEQIHDGPSTTETVKAKTQESQGNPLNQTYLTCIVAAILLIAAVYLKKIKDTSGK